MTLYPGHYLKLLANERTNNSNSPRQALSRGRQRGGSRRGEARGGPQTPAEVTPAHSNARADPGAVRGKLRLPACGLASSGNSGMQLNPFE
jgi:hypothetical protein